MQSIDLKKGEFSMTAQNEDSLVIDIHLTRGLVAILCLVLVAVATLGTLARGRGQAAAAAPGAPAGFAATGLRQFYLTKGAYDGAYADGSDGNGAGVCASGYHFASLWEIVDPSNLAYNSTLGWDWTELSLDSDMGQGPPSHWTGWVRTGYTSGSSTGTPGEDNCEAWTSDSESGYGTVVSLRKNWSSTTAMHVWKPDVSPCWGPQPVWCVED
jgi:hypothetical protein